MTLKIKVTSDVDHAKAIRDGLKETGGYCPCSLIQNDDTKCMCKEFREMNTPGMCHCGLYEKVEE